MVFDIKTLHNEVGLKLDDLVVYGIDSVKKVIEENQELFEDLLLSLDDNSHMIYGYNKLGNPVKLGFEDELVNRIILMTTLEDSKRFKAIISYDGHRYSGFQIQKDQITIQGELTKVIAFINGADTLIQGASRTDAGVHALNYVFHFNSDKPLTEEKWLNYLNTQLPKDIIVKSVKEVHPLFHTRYDVYKKRYIYKMVVNEINPFRINYEWFIKELNIEILEENLKQLVGTHDFKSFCKGDPDSTIRTIFNAELIQKQNELTLVFEGNGFLRYMIRIIVFALVQISNGNLELSISDIIKEKSREHTKNLAPAAGLYLEEITY
ncbi:MAG: tRNA pseudouridine(38-40) synthase TruA [Tenericutes bacterium]|nr:tRNA pseudouridine(38-40) synthase TruA [Mycoplasmatota bacterium]